MASEKVLELYRILKASKFDFIPRGEVEIHDIYKMVKIRYSDLCDDSYLCSMSCKNGTNRPEWQHRISNILSQFQKLGTIAKRGSSRGVWRFLEPVQSDKSIELLSLAEGRRLLRLHWRKERKPKLALRKKQLTVMETGKLSCEACDFDFELVYGKIGVGFAECHHRAPLADLDGIVQTTLEDLAIVCSNCHRILHRSTPMLSVDQLRVIVLERRVNPNDVTIWRD